MDLLLQGSCFEQATVQLFYCINEEQQGQWAPIKLDSCFKLKLLNP